MCGEDAPPVVHRADPNKVRRRLERILAEARAAQTMPWDWSQRSLFKKIFPDMANLLPEQKRGNMCFSSNRNGPA